MYFKFNVQAWVPDSNHVGCGRSVSETYNCASEEVAIIHFMKDYPTVKKENIKVYNLSLPQQ